MVSLQRCVGVDRLGQSARFHDVPLGQVASTSPIRIYQDIGPRLHTGSALRHLMGMTRTNKTQVAAILKCG
jgi:hypothetical protein